MKFVVAWKLKRRGLLRVGWRAYSSEKAAREHYMRLCGLTAYRSLSIGFGNVLEEQGRL